MTNSKQTQTPYYATYRVFRVKPGDVSVTLYIGYMGKIGGHLGYWARIWYCAGKMPYLR